MSWTRQQALHWKAGGMRASRKVREIIAMQDRNYVQCPYKRA
jgi:hypothetical protein